MLLTLQRKRQMTALQLLGERLKLHFISMGERNCVEISFHNMNLTMWTKQYQYETLPNRLFRIMKCNIITNTTPSTFRL